MLLISWLAVINGVGVGVSVARVHGGLVRKRWAFLVEYRREASVVVGKLGDSQQQYYL